VCRRVTSSVILSSSRWSRGRAAAVTLSSGQSLHDRCGSQRRADERSRSESRTYTRSAQKFRTRDKRACGRDAPVTRVDKVPGGFHARVQHASGYVDAPLPLPPALCSRRRAMKSRRRNAGPRERPRIFDGARGGGGRQAGRQAGASSCDSYFRNTAYRHVASCKLDWQWLRH